MRFDGDERDAGRGNQTAAATTVRPTDWRMYRDAGVGTLIAAPVAIDPSERRRMVRELAEML